MHEIDRSQWKIARAPASHDVDHRVQMTEAQIAENFRRAKHPCLVVVHSDGTKSFKEDRVHHGDGIRDTVGADRGEGSRESEKLLRAEGDVKVDGLLPREPLGPARGEDGRFVSKDDA